MIDKERTKKIKIAAHQRVKEKEYWLNKLAGITGKSCFPYDYSRYGKEIKDVDGTGEKQEEYEIGKLKRDVVKFQFSQELCSRLLKASKQSDYTLNVFLQAGLVALLGRYTGSDDIILGAPIYKQEIDGEFINSVLVLRNQLAGGMTFKSLLLQVRQTLIEAMENRNYPVEILSEQLDKPVVEGDDFPLFDCAILMENINDKAYLKHIRTNMNFLFSRVGETIKGRVEYNNALYKKTTIERIVRHYNSLMQTGILQNGIPLSGIEVLSEEEKNQLLCDFNDTSAGYPHHKTIHQLFEEHVDKRPDSISLVGKEERIEESVHISYRELNENSNQLAHLLIKKGVQPGTIVGIIMERTIEMIIGIMGILKAGAAYLPIDSDSPRQRIDYMLKDSNAEVLVSEVSKVSERTDIVKPSELREEHPTHLIHLTHPTHLCYIIYTSGTTGKPKGMLIEHRNVVRLMVNNRFLFDFNHRDIWTMFHSYCFDFSVWEMYGALLYGGRLVLVPGAVSRDMSAYRHLLIEKGVTLLNQTPSAFYHLAEEETSYRQKLLNIRLVIFGGEALKPVKLKKWREKYPDTKLVNMFGITETTVHVTYKEIGDKEIEFNISNIGKPIPTLNVYVVDAHQNLLPPGAPGELWVGGDGVGRGYLNRPELSHKKFIRGPFREGERVYRSGDLVRWQVDSGDGEMVYAGRIDHQVKIRGFRIELEEIEARLLKHQGIKEAVVISRNEENGDRYLCAYMVPDIDSPKGNGRMPDPAEWKEFLSRELPDYMIPSYFMQIDNVPLTPNGKLDLQALPVPELDRKKCTAPRNELEKRLVEIWKEVLTVRKEQEATGTIGIDSNFFEMGGHSLKATTLSLRLHKELNIRVPLKEIFTKPTIRELAVYIAGTAKNSYHRYQPIEAAEKKDYYNVSSSQQRLFIVYRMESTSTAYNLPQVVELAQMPHRNKLEDTFRKLIRRHEGLRTSFHFIAEEVVQKIHDADDVTFAIESCEAQKENMSVQDIIQNFVKPFDLSQPPLIRVRLIKTEGDRYLLAMDMHHIITDAVSSSIMVRDFMALYRGQGLPLLRVQHKDYSQWLNSKENQEDIKKQETYWLKEFAGEIPVLKIPIDYSRPSRYIFEGSSISFNVPEKEANALHKMALEKGVTLYMIFLSVYNILLSNLSNREDIVIITPVVGRHHTDLQDIIGMFANTLAIRNYPGGEKTFAAFLREIKEQTLKALDNQDYPFEMIVEKIKAARNPGHHPLSDFGFTFQDIEMESESKYNDTSYEKQKQYSYENPTTKFDLSFIGYSLDERLTITFEYSTRLFKKSTIRRFIEYCEDILQQVIRNRNVKLKDINVSHDLGITNTSAPQMDFNFGG